VSILATRFARVAATSVAVLGLAVLIGWAIGLQTLQSVAPGLATMKVNAALGFMAAGVSLLLFLLDAPAAGRSGPKQAARVLAGVVVALGALTLVEMVFPSPLGIDQLLFQDHATPPGSHPGRMSPLAAVSFVLIGIALLTLGVESRRGRRPAQFFGLVVAAGGAVAAIGYGYSYTVLGRLASYTSMALHTAIGFAVLGLAILCALPDGGIPGLFLAPGPGGIFARRVLPATCLSMLAIGWLTLTAERTELVVAEVEIGLMVIASILVVIALVYATGVAIEKTDARERVANDSVRSGERRTKAVPDAALDAVITIDGGGFILAFNSAAERLFGYTRAEAEGQEMAQLIVPPELRERHRGGLQRLVSTGEGRVLGKRMEMPALRRDGSVFPAELSITRVETAGAPVFTGFLRDVSDRQRRDAELRKSEERFRLLAGATSDVVWDWDVLDSTISWNEGVQKHFGYDPEAASADPGWWSRHVHPEDLSRVLAGIRAALAGTGSTWRDEYRFERADGSMAFVSDSGFIIRDAAGHAVRMVGATVDTTERRGLEEQLRQAQKMEAVGQLAGGVAHDFNNLLTAILGFAEFLGAKLRSQPELSDMVAEIRKAGERASGLTRQLLAFSRKEVLEAKGLDVNAIVRNLDKMLQRLIGENIELAVVLEPNLDRVFADAGHLEQVIVNLVVNARDAMPEGGKLTIETGNVDLDRAYAEHHASVHPGPHVMLAVSDTGIGMDAKTQARIFEPFFTTKGKDKGTGLGLSTLYGIVKQSAGSVWVYSELGKGTTFKIFLPRAEGDVAIAAVPAVVTRADAICETILLVEDEESLRRLARTILPVLGYHVLEAKDGAEGVQIAADYPGTIDLVLTDVVMPGVGGSELVRRIRAVRPDISVLYMSGYTDDAIVRHGVLEDGVSFLQKPFTSASLGDKLRGILHRSA
jgi:two-component system cell cycle sensor histidine kinase/response regulator CckA